MFWSRGTAAASSPERPDEPRLEFLISWMTISWFGVPTVLQTLSRNAMICAHVLRRATSAG
jgi:hypothetical protein